MINFFSPSDAMDALTPQLLALLSLDRASYVLEFYVRIGCFRRPRAISRFRTCFQLKLNICHLAIERATAFLTQSVSPLVDLLRSSILLRWRRVFSAWLFAFRLGQRLSICGACSSFVCLLPLITESLRIPMQLACLSFDQLPCSSDGDERLLVSVVAPL